MPDDSAPTPKTKASTLWMYGFWAWPLVLIFLDSFFGLSAISVKGRPDVGLAAISIVNIYCWFSADAQERGYAPGLVLKVGVVLVALFAVPIYVLSANGLKRALLAYAKFTLFLLCSSVVALTLMGVAEYVGFPHK
jgi:hypothetical protein